jgi:hypothetical protein
MNKKLTLTSNEIDTIVYFIEEGEREIRTRKLIKGTLSDADEYMLASAKQCKKVLFEIEQRRKRKN